MNRATLATVVALLLAVPAHAVTIHVPADQPTIQAGIDAASAGDTVRIACGTYYEHDIQIRTPLLLTSETGSPDCVTIDAAGVKRVLSVVSPAGSTKVVGLRLTNGVASGAPPDYYGGGTYCTSSSPSFESCMFVGDMAYVGGGIYCSSASVVLAGCLLDGNTAQDSGGGFFASSGAHIISDCSFVGNTAQSGGGGAIRIRDPGSPRIERCTFTNNTAVAGGALHFMWDATPTISACEIIGNLATGYGGAVFCGFSAAPVLSQCSIVRNSSAKGGAVASESSSPSFLRCTIVENLAPEGAAFHVFQSSIHVDSTIVGFNGLGEAVFCLSGGPPVFGCSDVYGNTGGDWAGCLQGYDESGLNFSADPLFCDPQVGDYALQEGSPCASPGATGCGLVGALPVGCGPVSLTPQTWARIKARFK